MTGLIVAWTSSSVGSQMSALNI